MRLFKTSALEMQSKSGKVVQRTSVDSFLKDLYVFVDIRSKNDGRSKMNGMLVNDLIGCKGRN